MNRMDKEMLREIACELGAHKETLEALIEDERGVALLKGQQEDDSLDRMLCDLAQATVDLESAIQLLESYF